MNMPTETDGCNSSSEQEKRLGLPFCGLGDIESLTSWLPSCGVSLVELPLPTCDDHVVGVSQS